MLKINNKDTIRMTMMYEWESVNPPNVWNKNHPAANYNNKVTRH